MKRFGLPEGCRGVDIGGRTLRPNRQGGTLVVNDSRTARAVKQALGGEIGYHLGSSPTATDERQSWSCECGRTNWVSDPSCRRCGKEKTK